MTRVQAATHKPVVLSEINLSVVSYQLIKMTQGAKVLADAWMAMQEIIMGTVFLRNGVVSMILILSIIIIFFV